MSTIAFQRPWQITSVGAHPRPCWILEPSFAKPCRYQSGFHGIRDKTLNSKLLSNSKLIKLEFRYDVNEPLDPQPTSPSKQAKAPGVAEMTIPVSAWLAGAAERAFRSATRCRLLHQTQISRSCGPAASASREQIWLRTLTRDPASEPHAVRLKRLARTLNMKGTSLQGCSK